MKTAKIALVIGIAAICTLPAMAGPHHHRHHKHGNDGVRLAANIIGLVNTALRGPTVVAAPAPVIVTRPAVYHCPPPPPRRRYHRPAPPHRPPHHHRGHHHRGGRR